MSNCAHRQSTYKLQEMPHCKKCRGELIYIMVKYINEKFFRWEWECVKCHKVYKEYSISLPELLEQDRELHAEDRFGIIELSWIQKETEVVYELKDSNGRRIQILWEFDHMLEYSQNPPFTVGLVVKNFLIDQKRLFERWAKFTRCFFRKRKLLPTAGLITAYLDAIKKDLPPPVTPENGKQTVKLLECIEESMNGRKPVKLSKGST